MFGGISRSGYKSGELSEPIGSELELTLYSMKYLKPASFGRAVKRIHPNFYFQDSQRAVFEELFSHPDKDKDKEPDSFCAYAMQKALKQFKKERTIQVIASNNSSPLLTWISGDPDINLNCQVKNPIDNKVISCEHLAYAYAEGKIGRRKPLFHEISTEAELQKYSGIKTETDIEQDARNGCPAHAIYFDKKQLPKALYKTASELTDDHPKRDLLFVTTNHAMALTLTRLGNGGILLHYYDPNKTLCHRKILARSINDLGLLSFNPLFEKYSGNYFYTNTQTCVIHSTETLPKRDNCQIHCLAPPSAALINDLMILGHFGHPSLSNEVSNMTWQQLSGKLESYGVNKEYWTGLGMAIKYFRKEAITDYVTVTIRSSFNIYVKVHLLHSCDHHGKPILHHLLNIEKHDLLEAYILPILSSNLKEYDINLILSGVDDNKKPALLYGLENNQLTAVKTFIDIVINSNLSSLAKVKILRGTLSFNDNPIITMLNKLGDIVPIVFYRNRIEESSLSESDKADILNPGILLYADEE